MPEPRLRAIASLTLTITEAPWTLSRADLATFHRASLSDEDILHVIELSSYFGHLNRIADVTGVPLDYQVKLAVPPTDTVAQAWESAPSVLSGRPAIDPARRPTTQAALAEWRNYIFFRDKPITKRMRVLLARWVATWLGDGTISSPTDLTMNPHDDLLRSFAELVTLAPWQITDDDLQDLRNAGFDDAGIFDIAATVSSAGVFSRIEVALAALAT